LQRLLDLKNKSNTNIADVIKIASVSKEYSYNADVKSKTAYIVRAYLSDYVKPIDLAVGQSAEKLNKQNKYKFTGALTCDLNVGELYAQNEIRNGGIELSMIAKNLARSGAIKVNVVPVVKAPLISLLPVDDANELVHKKSEQDLDADKPEFEKIVQEYHTGKSLVELDGIKESLLTKCNSYIGRNVTYKLKISDIQVDYDGWYVISDSNRDIFKVRYKTNSEKVSEIKKGQVFSVSGLVTSFEATLMPRYISYKKEETKKIDVFVIEIRDNK